VNFINKWKPILFFQKEPVKKFEKTFSDYFISEKPEKSEHEWQQSIAVYEHIIDIFTEPGQLVVDPFLGGGTTAVACKRLKRKFIGSEIDENSYKLILQRLNDDEA
jgi:DNA modification methylase